MLSGDRVAHYQLSEKIGAGGMGEVYRARDLRLDRSVALKILPRHLSADAEGVTRFLRESKAASALNHPNIVTIYDADRTDVEGETVYFMAMELVDGVTLRERMNGHDLDLAAMLSLAAQTADALAKAHAHGIVHRDLKPENIMVTSEGYAKLLDFGLAKKVPSPDDRAAPDTVTRDGMIVGTVSYMSPEQIRGEELDGRSDLFSLGCILYELVARRRPFTGDSTVAALHSTLYDEVAVAGDSSAGLRRCIERCLKKDPAERYASAKELASDLRRLLHELEEPPERRLLTIAVLPFRDLTPAADNPHIGLGLADAIITELAASRKLIVRPTAAIVPYHARPIDPVAAGRELGVDAVVDGGFQRAGARLRVTVQVVSTKESRSLWATKIDSSLEDVFAMQDEVSRHIAESLSVELAPAPERRAPQAAAYELYLQGRMALFVETIEKTREAVATFERATTIDPSFAPAWAGLADACARIAYSWEPTESWYHQAVVSCDRALALAPDLAEARYVRSRLLWTPQAGFDVTSAMRESAAALRAQPNLGQAHARLSVILFHIGALDEAMYEVRKALLIHPADELAAQHVGTLFFLRGRWEEALSEIDKCLRRVSLSEWPLYVRAHALTRLGRDDEAAEVVAFGEEHFPGTAHFIPVRALLAARAGDEPRARIEIAHTIERQKAFGHYHHAQYDVGCALAVLGDREEGMRWILDAASNGFPSGTWFANDTLLQDVLGGPELDAIIEELNAEAEKHCALYRALSGAPNAASTTMRLERGAPSC
jgi:eukaryotic-like serine/threonine-protein kinase